MLRTARTKGENNDDSTQKRPFSSGSGRVQLSLPSVLSAPASDGASRSGKQFPCDACGPLSLAISIGGGCLASHRIQTERAAEDPLGFPHRLLVRRVTDRSHAFPLGMVAILKPQRRSPPNPRPTTQDRQTAPLTLYIGRGSTLEVKGGKGWP